MLRFPSSPASVCLRCFTSLLRQEPRSSSQHTRRSSPLCRVRGSWNLAIGVSGLPAGLSSNSSWNGGNSCGIRAPSSGTCSTTPPTRRPLCRLLDMPIFRSADGTELAYHVHGSGAPLVCVPGGPMRASSYLSDLGGLAESRQLVLLDLRGTGQSAVRADRTSYRCDRLVDDVRALQDHLGLPTIDLLGHSAGANIVVQFAERHPERVAKLVLACPSTRAVGLEVDSEMRRSVMQLRQHEPWFAEAAAAFERIQVNGGSADDWTAIAPMLYGRWDAAAQADYAGNDSETNEDAAKEFGADGAFDPPATRAALSGFSS